jgi:hypothetical protein
VRAVVAGLVGSYPFGGMTYHYLQYVLGLKALGWNVSYLEDTGKWFYDPESQTFSEDCTHNVAYLDAVMQEFGLTGSWCLRDTDDRWHGPLAGHAPEFVADADLLLNVSGACWLRPEYRRCRRIVYVDTDPGYTQLAIREALGGRAAADVGVKVDLLATHDFHATYAENIWDDDCSIPTEPFRWIPTRQPIVLDLWPVRSYRGGPRFTTVMSWTPYGAKRSRPGSATAPPTGKQRELERVLGLPRRAEVTMEIAMSGKAPSHMLARQGWRIRPAYSVSRSPSTYRRYISSSAAEFSVVKALYAETRSGWFSERTTCYLASGRPAVLQDTGYSARLPVGLGLHAFRSAEQATEGISQIVNNYAVECQRAREIASEFFDARKVLGRLLTAVGL